MHCCLEYALEFGLVLSSPCQSPVKPTIDKISMMFQMIDRFFCVMSVFALTDLVTGNHETCVSVSIGDLDVCLILDKIFDNFQMAVKTGRSQCRTIRFCRTVDISSFANQEFDDFQVTSGTCAPQWRCTFDILAFEIDQARLFDICTTTVNKILDNIQIAVLARHDETCGAVELRFDNCLAFILAAFLEILFELLGFACFGHLKDKIVWIHVFDKTRIIDCRRLMLISCHMSGWLCPRRPILAVDLE